jgi:hypothetical protein
MTVTVLDDLAVAAIIRVLDRIDHSFYQPVQFLGADHAKRSVQYIHVNMGIRFPAIIQGDQQTGYLVIFPVLAFINVSLVTAQVEQLIIFLLELFNQLIIDVFRNRHANVFIILVYLIFDAEFGKEVSEQIADALMKKNKFKHNASITGSHQVAGVHNVPSTT